MVLDMDLAMDPDMDLDMDLDIPDRTVASGEAPNRSQTGPT